MGLDFSRAKPDIFYIIDAFIITVGQDNIQNVAGEMLTFWSQLGFVFGKFPFVGWSRGWYSEDTENNYNNMVSDPGAQMKTDIIRTVTSAVEMSKLNRINNFILLKRITIMKKEN